MVVNNVLFKTHLNYQIQASIDEQKDDNLDVNDVKHIDLHRCTFADFKQAMIYVRENNSDFNFSDFTIDAVKPAPVDFSEDKKYDFVGLTDYAKHTAITIGNMSLFNELQKVASAAERFNYNVSSASDKKIPGIVSFEDYDRFDVIEPTDIFQELGSCVIGGGNSEAIKLTATFHDSSTEEHPIISVRAFDLGTSTYLPNRDIIALDTIYMPNASIMEVFAFMSYRDYKNNTFNHSFDKLLFSGRISVDSLEDMYSLNYDISQWKLD